MKQSVIRLARPVDLVGILRVETAAKGELSQVYLDGELKNPLARLYLAESPTTGQICAYLLGWMVDEETFELHHLATHPDWQRTGLGAALVDFLCAQFTGKLKSIFLEVRRGNARAIAFYEAYGFRCIATRSDYYQHPIEDALIYQYSISVER